MSDLDLIFVCTTHNPMGSLRWDLLEETMRTARVAFSGCPKMLVDNCSNDGSFEAVHELAVSVEDCFMISANLESEHGNHSPGFGRTIAWKNICRLFIDADLSKTIIVMSDDDMRWSSAAKEWILSFWQDAPDDVAILCAYLEPEFEWNTIRGVLDNGQVRALVRDSAPGAAWTFPMSMGKKIFPVPMTFGYDHKTCLKLHEQGLRVVQMDLCEHMGWESSSHGNDAVLHAKPVDRARWGL